MVAVWESATPVRKDKVRSRKVFCGPRKVARIMLDRKPLLKSHFRTDAAGKLAAFLFYLSTRNGNAIDPP